MKNLFLLGLFLAFSASIQAQETKIEKAAEKTGDAIERTAVKADKKARKIHKDKVAATKQARKDVNRVADKIEKKAEKAGDK